MVKANPIVLITGASNGIGLELAKIFATNKHNLVLVARSYEKLKNIASYLSGQFGIETTIYAEDLSISSTPERLYDAISSEGYNVEILVNNAGFGWRGNFYKMPLVDALEMIQVNITALTHLTNIFLPDMVKRGYGKILNVASTAAFQPGPVMATYYASKAYVLNFSLAIAEELKSTGVTVTTLCPGPTPTGFGERAGFGKREIFNGWLSMDVTKVAKIGYKGLMKNKKIVIPGWKNYIGTQIVRLLPRTLPPKLVKIFQEKRVSEN